MNLGGFGKDAKDAVFNKLLSRLNEYAEQFNDAGHAAGAAIGEGYEEGYEETKEVIKKSKKELLDELSRFQKDIERTMDSFPETLKKAFKNFNFNELSKAGNTLKNSLRKINSITSELSDLGVNVDIDSWMGSMSNKAEALSSAFDGLSGVFDNAEASMDKIVKTINEQSAAVDESSSAIDRQGNSLKGATNASKEYLNAQKKLLEIQRKLKDGDESGNFKRNGVYSGRKGRLVLASRIGGEISRNFKLSNDEIDKLIEDSYDQFSKIRNLIVDRQEWGREIKATINENMLGEQFNAAYSSDILNELRPMSEFIELVDSVRSGSIEISDAMRQIGILVNQSVKNTDDVDKLTSSYEGLADAVKKYINASKKLWDAYDNKKDFNSFAGERNAAIEEIIKHLPLDAPGVDASLLRDGYEMALQSQEWSRSYAGDGAESMLRAVEADIQNAISQMEAEQRRLAEANKQITETAKLIGSLQEKYGADKANQIFGDTINSFSKDGGLNVHTAKDMYDALIAKEQEYLAEIKKRQETLNEFNRINQGVLELHSDSEDVQMKAGELAARIIEGKLTQVDATKQLAEYIEETIDKESQLQKTVEETTDSIKEQRASMKDVVSQAPSNDISQIIPRDILDKILHGIDIEGIISGYGLSGDKLTHATDLFKDFAGARYLGELSPKSAESIFNELFDFVSENAQHTEAVVKTLQDFREHMKLVQIGIPENMEQTFAAEFVDMWGDLKKLYAIGGNSKNKKKLLTTSKYASTPDVLINELINEGFGSVFDTNMMKNFNGSAQDALRMILDAVQRAKDEYKLPNVQTIFGLDEYGERDFSERIVAAINIVEQNITDVNAALISAVSNGDDLSDSIERQANSEKRLAEAASATADAKKKQANDASNAVSVEEIIARDMDSALEKLSSAKNNETTLFNLKGVLNGDDLVKQAQEMVKNIAAQSNLRLGLFDVEGDTIKVQLYNDELKVTVDQMYKLKAASEEAESATLELTKTKYRQNVKALNANPFDSTSAQDAALSSIDKLRADAERAKYDLSALEKQAKSIGSTEDISKFNTELKNTQNKIQAIKNSTATKSSMNPLINMQRDMSVANTEIDTMRLKLDKLGDIQGVKEASNMIADMKKAVKEYNDATTSEDQQNAYNNYSDLRNSFRAQMDYINAAKALKDSRESSAKQVDPIKDQYKSILDTITKINSLNSDILKYQNKDGGSGLFAEYIKQLQTEKSQLVVQLQSITQEINKTLNEDFAQGKEYSLPFAKLLSDDGWLAISEFLNNTKTQASLTTEEIEKLITALQKSQSIDVEAAAKAADQFRTVQETYKQIMSLGNLDKNNVNYQAIGGMFADIIKYKNMLSDDPTQWSAQEIANLQKLIENFNKYGGILVQVGQKEEKYFADKERYTQDTTMSSMAEDAKKSAEQIDTAQQKLTNAAKEFAKESGSDALITNFAKTADGISRLDFSVFDKATGSLRNFRMEMGSVTDGMYVTETTVNKSLANIQTAQKQLQSIGGLIGRLGASGVNIGEGTAPVQVQKLLTLHQQLSSEINKGGSADQGVIADLTKRSKIAAAEVEKLYKQMVQMDSAIENGQSTGIGKGDPVGDIYGQLANEARSFADNQGNATLQIGRFDKATNTLYGSIIHTSGAVEEYKFQMNGLNGQMIAQEVGIGKLENSWDKFKSTISSAGKHLATALVGSNIFFKAISEIRKGVSYVKEIDLALTELKKVTDEAEESYRKFLKTAASTAGEIGSTVSDFTRATANFARLGYTMSESADMAKTAIVYRNVADGLDNVEEATDSIISTMKAFGIESNNTMGIVDRFNEVGNNFSITSAGIGDALQRSASALYAAGNTIDESIALVTAANSVIQNPEQVGTALKTLSLRIRGVKTELAEAGLETEGMAETTAQLQAKLKALTHGKVDIMLNADTFKNTTQILREMSAAWEEMTDIERAAALELIGGKRQANILSSVITNFETVEDVIETSMNSSGSAMKENAKWMDSIEGKSIQLTNAMQALWNEIINSDAIKFFLDFALGATKVVDAISPIPSVLAGVVGYFAIFKKITPVSLFKDLITNLRSYEAAMQQVSDIKSLNLNMTSSGMLGAQSVKAYSQALEGLSAKQQAAILTSAGLEKAHIAQVLAQQGVEDATIRQLVGQEALNKSKQAAVAMTGAEIQATLAKQGVTLSDVTATWLADNATKELTKDEVLKASAMLMSKGATEQEIVALLNLAGASKTASINIKEVTASLGAMMLSNPIGLILALVSGFSILISMAKKAQEEMEKVAKESVDAYKETQKTLKDSKRTINDIADDYEKLAKGVDELGNNVSLSTSEYERYNEIVNQIADMFPTMVKGYTDEGNAIIKNKGNVEALTKAYAALQEQANVELLLGGKNIMQNYKNTMQGSIFAVDNSTSSNIAAAKELKNILGAKDYDFSKFDPQVTGNATVNASKVHEDIWQLLRDAGIESKFKESKSEYVQRAINEFPSIVNSIINSWEATANAAVSQVQPLVSAYLDTSLGYAGLTSEQKQMIDAIASDFDAEFFNQFNGDASKMYTAIENIILKIKSAGLDDDFSTTLDVQTKFNNGQLTYGEYIAQINSFVAILDKLQKDGVLDAETIASLKVFFDIEPSDGSDANDALLKSAESLLNEQDRALATTLTKTDLEIVNQYKEEWLKIEEAGMPLERLKELIIEARKEAGEFSVSNMLDSMNTVQSAFSKLGDAYNDFVDNGIVTADALADIEESFRDVDGFDDFIAVLGNSNSSVDDVKAALSGLATEYLKTSGALDNLTDENEQFVISQLKAFGVVNAEEYIAGIRQVQQAYYEAYGDDLSNYATVEDMKLKISADLYDDFMSIEGDEIDELAKAYGIDLSNFATVEKQKTAIALAEAKKRLLGDKAKDISDMTTKNNAERGAQTVGEGDIKGSGLFGTGLFAGDKLVGMTYDEVAAAYNAGEYDDKAWKSNVRDWLSEVETTWFKNRNDAIAEIEGAYNKEMARLESEAAKYNALDEYVAQYVPTLSVDSSKLGGPDSDSSSKSDDKFEETFDWIEVRIDEINEKIDLTKAKLENAVDAASKNSIIDTLISYNKTKIDNLKAGITAYENEAKNLLSKIDQKYWDKIMLGDISVEKFIDEAGSDVNEEQLKAIKEYIELMQKAASLEQEVEETKSDNRSKSKEKFDNVATEYENEISLIEAENDLLKAQADLLEDQGYEVVNAQYDQMIANTSEMKDKLEEERNALVNLLNSGDIPKYSAEWYDMKDAIADVDSKIIDCTTNIEDFAQTKIDNIAKQFDNFNSIIDKTISILESNNELLETDQGFASESIYDAVITEKKGQLALLEQQRNEMQDALDNSGLKEGTNEWYDAANAILDVDNEIVNLKVDIENLQDESNNLHWDQFDLLIKKLKTVSTEADNLLDILGTQDAVDELGNWTNEGITSLGLLAQKMEEAEMTTSKYQEEIKYLNDNWESLGYTNEEYVDKLDELKSGQYDAIQSYYDAKDAIVDLNKTRIDAIKNGIEEEIEAYEKLINAKKEELNAEKDLHDFQKSVAEKQKDIASIQRQLAALSGNNSMSARAKRAKLEAQLAEAQAELEETYYDRSISNQQDSLDKELENFKNQKDEEVKIFEDSLKNIEAIVADSLSMVQENASVVYATLTAMGKQYGLDISSELTNPWLTGQGAIQDYGNKLNISLIEMANMLGLTVDEFAEKLGLSIEELVGNLDITVAQMAQNLGLTNEELAKKLGMTTTELSGMMGLTAQELAARLGITLPELASKLGTTTAGLAGDLNMTMAQFADKMGLTVSELAGKLGLTYEDLANKLGMTYQDMANPFGLSMSSTVDALKNLENEYQKILQKIKEDSEKTVADVNKAMEKYKDLQNTINNKDNTKDNNKDNTGTNANTGNNNSTGSNNGNKPTNDKTEKDYYGVALAIWNGNYGWGTGSTRVKNLTAKGFDAKKVQQIVDQMGKDGYIRSGAWRGKYHGITNLASYHLNKFAKGTTGVNKDQLAIIDELGEELVIRAQNGKLAYLEKGSGVVPADLTSNLMEWGKLDPSGMLDQNRPAIGVHPEIHNTEINISVTYGDMISIDEYNGGDIKDLEKMVAKQFEKHTKDLNNSIRRYVR